MRRRPAIRIRPSDTLAGDALSSERAARRGHAASRRCSDFVRESLGPALSTRRWPMRAARGVAQSKVCTHAWCAQMARQGDRDLRWLVGYVRLTTSSYFAWPVLWASRKQSAVVCTWPVGAADRYSIPVHHRLGCQRRSAAWWGANADCASIGAAPRQTLAMEVEL